MAGKTNLSATLFSQKKLLGKSSTGTHRADSNEPIPSGLQVATSAVFAEDIPSSPSRTLFTVQSPGSGKPNTVEYVEFKLQEVTGSAYDANDFDSEVGSQGSGIHAYRLVLSESYQANSNSAVKGTYPFVDNQILHWTLGGLQMVSPGFSNDLPNPYDLKLYESDGSEIPLLDEIDWQIDYFSGILFVQDYDASKIPENAKGFIYVGKMLSQSLGDISALAGGGGSPHTPNVGWSAPGAGSISTTGSLFVGTNINPEISLGSVGGAVFNEQGRNVDFRVETTGDQNTFFVKGSTNKVGIGLNAPATTLHVKDSDPGVRIQREANTENSTLDFAGSAGVVGASVVHEANSNDLVFNLFNGSAVEESLRLGGYSSAENRQVIILSGTGIHAGAMQPRETLDTAFFVSGSIGSKDSTIKGTSVFGGDLVVSGSIFDGAGNQITGGGGGGSVSFSGGNGSDNQMITADGSGDIVAESNITFNGTELNVSGDILPGSDNTFDLGSPTARFANIYTGDLHLRNERGHWQIVEEADALTVINRLTGKRYKMVLEPYVEDVQE